MGVLRLKILARLIATEKIFIKASETNFIRRIIEQALHDTARKIHLINT